MISIDLKPADEEETTADDPVVDDPFASRIADNGIELATNLIAEFEGFRAEPYYATEHEQEKGIQTIGFGRIENVDPDSVTTREAELEYLRNQVNTTYGALERELGADIWNDLTAEQKASLASLAYNVDKDVVGQLKRSKALAALRDGDHDTFKREAFDERRGFTKQNGEVLRGLVKRRQKEQELFDSAQKKTLS